MRKIALLSASLGAMLACMLPTMPAHAQFWVASFGSGTTCSRASPCATFQAAHNAATAGAGIACVDAVDYGRVIITKSITIDCTTIMALPALAKGSPFDRVGGRTQSRASCSTEFGPWA